MGFSLGAFGAGFAGGLADTAAEQRKDMDNRIDKYLDFGVQRGAKVMDERKAQRTELTRLGNQLQQRMLSDEQISVILEGGADSARSFLDAIQVSEQSMPKGEVFDASTLVTMENEKPSTMTWQDYVDKRIMGTANTSDVFSNSGVRSSSSGSILGKMFGVADTNTVSGDAVRARAGIVGNTMGASVEDSLAASQNNFDRIADNKAAKGFIRLAGNPVEQQRLITSKKQFELLKLQFQISTATIAATEADKPNVDLARKVTEARLKNEQTKLEYQIDEDTDVKTLQLQIEILEKQAKMAGVPSSWEKASLLVSIEIADMLKIPEADRDLEFTEKMEMLQKKQVDIGVSTIAFYGQRSGKTAAEIWTRPLLVGLFKIAQATAIALEFKDGTDGILQLNSAGEQIISSGQGAEYGEAFARANANAYKIWQETAAGLSASGIVFNAMNIMYENYKTNFDSVYPAVVPEAGGDDWVDVTTVSPENIVDTQIYRVASDVKGKYLFITGAQVLAQHPTLLALNKAGNEAGDETPIGVDTEFSKGGNVRVWSDTSNDVEAVEAVDPLFNRYFRKEEFPAAYNAEVISNRTSASMVNKISKELDGAGAHQKALLLVAAKALLPRIQAGKDAEKLKIIIEQLKAYEQPTASDTNQ